MTIKQKQCLLAYLGYYVGNIDGKWGTLSRIATGAFQKDYGLDVDQQFGPKTETRILEVIYKGESPIVVGGAASPIDVIDWDKIKWFKRSEFACHCGGKYCNGFPVEPDPELVRILEKIREHFGRPVRITSAIRDEKHNAAVGGASGSQHKLGKAADIQVDGVSPAEVANYAETLLPNRGGIGRYKNFTHVDTRAKKARWNG